ncbi:hypothetical protein [Ascidiimonas aurantiaca]|uniref:hypothetical protein n=1 Tax=Ascidiimonas aurantiaca TaxID=1685432 RepID=UPI0030ED4F72
MKKVSNLVYMTEPELTFGSGQKADDPRDGLLLFGPNEKFDSLSLKAGVIGTKEGITSYSEFVKSLQSPMISKKKMYGNEIEIESQRPSFPGFEATFGVKWNPTPELSIQIDDKELADLLKEKVKKKRTNKIVELYASKVLKARKDEDVRLDIWFVVVPRDIYLHCRFGSKGLDISKKLQSKIDALNQGQIGMFQDFDDELRELDALKDDSSDFHNLLKARLLQERVETPIQVIVETTLNFRDKLLNKKYTDDIKAHLAWTQSVAVYYKLGKLPWALNSIRDEVCYVGLVFKRISEKAENSSVCSAAQMFLKDGDGTIFRGNIGLFKSENSPDYHLDATNAEHLLGMALDDFKDKRGSYPAQLFVHGKVRFNDEEWRGFQNAVDIRGAETSLNGIVIKDTRSDPRKRLKLFKDTNGQKCEYGVMRGLGWIVDDQSAYLFTRGYIPRIDSTNHLEIANPLYVEINRGNEDIKTVLKDVLALTKLNYNACVYGDGLPVTLRFSDLIGNILTATSEWQSEMRQFRYYI